MTQGIWYVDGQAKAKPGTGHIHFTFGSGTASIELMVPIHQALALMQGIHAASVAVLSPAATADLHPFPAGD